MRYLRVIISLLLFILIVAIVIWSWLFMVIIAAIAAPFIAWRFKKAAASAAHFEATSKTATETTDNPAPYKVVEVEYEIVEK